MIDAEHFYALPKRSELFRLRTMFAFRIASNLHLIDALFVLQINFCGNALVENNNAAVKRRKADCFDLKSIAHFSRRL